MECAVLHATIFTGRYDCCLFVELMYWGLLMVINSITIHKMKKFAILFGLLMFIPLFSSAATTTVRIYPTDEAWQFLYDEDNQTTWAAARGYTGTLYHDTDKTSNIIAVRSDANSGKYRIYRASMLFDTSVIPENATIQSASLNVYRLPYENDSMVFTAHSRASTTDFVKTDWQLSHYGTEFARGTLLDNQHTSFSLNASGTGYINSTGYTDFGVMTAADFDNVDRGSTMTGAAFATSKASGTSTDPYLEVTYTE